MHHLLDEIKAVFSHFFKDFTRLFVASKSTTIMILLLEVFLGLFLILELKIVGDGIDAIIGARQVRVWTSDIQNTLKMQMGLFMILVGTIHLKEHISGVAARLGKNIRETMFVTSTFFASIAAAPVWITLSLIGLLVVSQIKSKVVRVFYSVFVIVITYFAMLHLLNYAVFKSISVGKLIWWGGALLGLSAWMILKPHLIQSDIK